MTTIAELRAGHASRSRNLVRPGERRCARTGRAVEGVAARECVQIRPDEVRVTSVVELAIDIGDGHRLESSSPASAPSSTVGSSPSLDIAWNRPRLTCFGIGDLVGVTGGRGPSRHRRPAFCPVSGSARAGSLRSPSLAPPDTHSSRDLHFTASDPEGSASRVVVVSVPHKKNSAAIDGGELFDSTS